MGTKEFEHSWRSATQNLQAIEVSGVRPGKRQRFAKLQVRKDGLPANSILSDDERKRLNRYAQLQNGSASDRFQG